MIADEFPEFPEWRAPQGLVLRGGALLLLTRSRSRRGGGPTTRRVHPKASDSWRTGDGPLQLLRTIRLALPEAGEKMAWGEPTFRVRDKMFAMCTNDHHRDSDVDWNEVAEHIKESYRMTAPRGLAKLVDLESPSRQA